MKLSTLNVVGYIVNQAYGFMINMAFYAVLGLLVCYIVLMCFRPYKESIMNNVLSLSEGRSQR